jgi:hypothetical protein
LPFFLFHQSPLSPLLFVYLQRDELLITSAFFTRWDFKMK